VRRTGVGSAVAIVTALLLSGCLSTGGGRSEPAISVHTITSSSQIQLPLARFGTTPADQEAMFAAINIEQRDCARRFGVISTIPMTTDQLTEVQSDTVRRYGVINAGEVARYGYDLPPSADGSDSKSGPGAWNPTVREAEVLEGHDASGQPVQLRAADGTRLPAGGCGLEGTRVVWGGKQGPQNDILVGTLLGDAWAETMADSRAQAVAAKWSACMASHGYDFKHRWDAGNSVATKDQATKIAMAKLDLSCALKTNYTGVWYAVDSAYQQRLINAHEGELTAAMDQYHQMMARVHRILQGAQ